MEFELTKEQKRRQAAARRRQQEPEDTVGPQGQTPPQDLSMEGAVLGALMLEKDAYSVVCDILSPACFYDGRHQKIYEAIQSLGAMQRPIDMLTVTDQLRVAGTIDEVGGPAYIAMLTSNVTSAANVEYHARIVQQKYIARELISYSSQVQRLAFDDSFDVLDVLQEAEGKLFELSNNNVKKDVVQIDPIIEQAISKIQEASVRESGISGLATGFDQLDKLTSGWQNSDLIIIAARPAMGKTAFVLSMAVNMAMRLRETVPVAVFSLEMSNLQLVNRIISNVCEIGGEKIKNGRLTQPEWVKFMSDVKQLYSAPLYIDDTAALSVFELRTKARRLVREHGVRAIIIDYLQLMNATGMKFGSREQEVSIISRSLKQLAKELNIPIIALSQLNRGVENRGTGDDTKNKRPQLSDLRESGAIEQDADIVCFIHRPEYYLHSKVDGEGKNIDGLAEFIVAKHRSGATDIIKMRFVNAFARFQNWEENYLDPAQTATVVHESKMNSEPDNAAPMPPIPDSMVPPPPAFDTNFIASNEDSPF